MLTSSALALPRAKGRALLDGNGVLTINVLEQENTITSARTLTAIQQPQQKHLKVLHNAKDCVGGSHDCLLHRVASSSQVEYVRTPR